MAARGSLFGCFKNGHPRKNERGRKQSCSYVTSPVFVPAQVDPKELTRRTRFLTTVWLHFKATVLFSNAGCSYFAFGNLKLFSEYLQALDLSSWYLYQNLPRGKFVAMVGVFKQEPKGLMGSCFNICKPAMVLLRRRGIGINVSLLDNISTYCSCLCDFNR